MDIGLSANEFEELKMASQEFHPSSTVWRDPYGQFFFLEPTKTFESLGEAERYEYVGVLGVISQERKFEKNPRNKKIKDYLASLAIYIVHKNKQPFSTASKVVKKLEFSSRETERFMMAVGAYCKFGTDEMIFQKAEDKLMKTVEFRQISRFLKGG